MGVKWRTVNTLKYTVIGIIVVTFIGSLGILQWGGQGPTDTTWERVQENNVLVVGVDIGFPPFALYNPSNGQTEGIDIDLAQALAAELGVQVRIVWVGVDSRYDKLFLGDVDVLIAAIRPEPLRLGFVRYTDPYFDGGYVLVSKANRAFIEQLQDLGSTTLGIEIASIGEAYIRDYLAENSPFVVKRYLSAARVLEALLANEVSYGLVDGISAHVFVHQHPEFSIISDPLTTDAYVIAVRRTDWRLHLEIENALDRLQQRGITAIILERWL